MSGTWNLHFSNIDPYPFENPNYHTPLLNAIMVTPQIMDCTADRDVGLIARRSSFELSAMILKELKEEDPQEYKLCMRMSPQHLGYPAGEWGWGDGDTAGPRGQDGGNILHFVGQTSILSTSTNDSWMDIRYLRFQRYEEATYDTAQEFVNSSNSVSQYTSHSLTVLTAATTGACAPVVGLSKDTFGFGYFSLGLTEGGKEMPALKEEPLGLTPYQGTKRTYGYFKCSECKTSWTSAWSWRDTAQKCQSWLQDNYPYRQKKLKRNKGAAKAESKKHKTDMCGKCIRRGKPCNQFKTI